MRRYWIGSTGPFWYDETKNLPNELGKQQTAFRTEGQMIVEDDPAEEKNVVRLIDLGIYIKPIVVSDLDNPTELTQYSSSVAGGLAVAVELKGSSPADYTIYAWDNDCPGADSPFVVPCLLPSNPGAWIAVAGRYKYSSQRIKATLDANVLQLNGNSSIKITVSSGEMMFQDTTTGPHSLSTLVSGGSASDLFWEEDDKIGFKVQRAGKWLWIQANATLNGLSIYKVTDV